MSVHCLISEQKLDFIREVVNQSDPKDDYKLIRSIGVGTYGEVYKALRLRTKDYAAVKIIKVDAKDDIKAVLQEIQTLRDCRHQNIVEFYDSYFRHNKLWICMEFCGGYSMQDIYTNIRKPVDEDCIAYLSRETLRGIDYMHRQGKIHRDIKGANILLCEDGSVKIADFGVAAQITQTIQRRNSLIGTPYWMAPEVVAVEKKGGYDEKCDIWAVGITAIEYAELQPPMFDLNPLKALRILSMKSYKPPVLRNKAKWSAKFHGFLKYALTKNEKKRPTAALMLSHDFVAQPHLSHSLTLRLLQINRNPDLLTVPQMPSSAAAAASRLAAPVTAPDTPVNRRPLASAQARAPQSRGIVGVGAAASSSRAANRPIPPNAAAPSSNGGVSGPVARSAHDDVDIKPPATRFPFSSAGMEAASKYVAAHHHQEGVGFIAASEPKTPTPSRPQPAAAPAKERARPNPLYPRFPVRGVVASAAAPPPAQPAKRLEDVRIMDELATQLPAYAANGPTASPAPKPASPTLSFSSASTSPCSTRSPSTTSSPSSSPSASSSEDDMDVEEDEEEEYVEEEDMDMDVKKDDGLGTIGPISLSKSMDSQSAAAKVTPAENGRGKEPQPTPQTGVPTEMKDKLEENEFGRRTLTTSDFAAADLDLDVADEQLLAADGVLTLGKCSNRSDSMNGDRISEFGFRIHGNQDEDEEEEEEDDANFDDIDPESGFVAYPGASRPAENGPQYRASLREVNGASGDAHFQRRRPRRGKSDPKLHHLQDTQLKPGAAGQIPRRQASESTMASSSVSKTGVAADDDHKGAGDNKSKPGSDFFPEKTGAELADMLRQLKFAQKFAWLAGEPSAAPLGLSSFNPGSVPTLHHAASSPDATRPYFNGVDGLVPGASSVTPSPSHGGGSSTTSQNQPAPRITVTQTAIPRPKMSEPVLSTRTPTLSRSSIATAVPVSPPYSPFARSSGMQSVINLAETPASPSERRTVFSVSASNECASPPSSQPATAQQPSFQFLDEVKSSQTHLSNNDKTSPSSTEQNEHPQSPLLAREKTIETRPDASSTTPTTAALQQKQQQHAFTSPCLYSKPMETIVISTPTSHSLDSGQRKLRHQSHAKREESDAAPSGSSVLRRIVEEQRLDIPSGPAPLAGLEDEEEDNDESGELDRTLEAPQKEADDKVDKVEEEPAKSTLDLPIPSHSIIRHPRRVVSFSAGLASPRNIALPPSSFSCTELTMLTLPNRLWPRKQPSPKASQHRRTASAPSVKEQMDPAEVVTSQYAPPQQSDERQAPEVALKSVATEPVIKKISVPNFEMSEAAPMPTYLSPQPPRAAIMRHRPPSTSALSVDHQLYSKHRHQLQRSSMVDSGLSGCYSGQPPWVQIQPTTGLPPTPKVHMGACFTLVVEGCLLTINSTASWINPATNGQVLLFGSTEGIYYLSLKDLADSSLELLSPRYCHWLAVVQNTMVTVSGNPPHLYTHNLTTLMKMKASGHSMNAKFTRIFPNRFSPSKKVSDTKGCLKASLVRSPFTGARYLCAAFPHEVLVMEWVNTLSNFIETKRVPVVDMPSSLTSFDLLVQQDLRFPLACLGVYRHHSRRGEAGERYRLHLVDLNAPSSTCPSLTSAAGPGHVEATASLQQVSSPVATSAERKKSSKSSRPESGFFAPEVVTAAAANAAKSGDSTRKASEFLDADRLPVVSVIQLLNNTVLVCFPDCAKLVNFNGRLRKKLCQLNTIPFDGLNIESVVGLRDSLLVFHPHGFLGKTFSGELTQEINDDKHIYRVLGHDRHIVVESRPVSGTSHGSNIYLLAGHIDNFT